MGTVQDLPLAESHSTQSPNLYSLMSNAFTIPSDAAPAKAKTKRIVELDSLRAIAALNLGCVFIGHVNHAGVPTVLSMLAGIVFVIAVSTLVTYKIEGPVTAWLRRRYVGLKESVAARRETVPASTTQNSNA